MRLDGPGKRASGGKAADCETFVTEYLRDRVADLEGQLARMASNGAAGGGGDSARLRQQVSDMAAETRSAIKLAAKVERLSKEANYKDHELGELKDLLAGAGHNPEAYGSTAREDEKQTQIFELQEEIKTLIRGQELGVNHVAGAVSQQMFDEVVAENVQLRSQLEDQGVSGGQMDVQALQAVRNEIHDLTRENVALKTALEEEQLRSQQLQASQDTSADHDGCGCPTLPRS